MAILAGVMLAAALVACGGGGGGSSGGGSTGGSGSSDAESSYLLAEFVAADVNHQTVRVWDPAHPATTVQSVSIVQDSGIAWTSSHLVFADATSYDAATRTVTTLGHARVFFDNNGKLYTIDLRGGHSHVPALLSSATDAFRPVKAFPMNAAGDDAWVDVQGSSHHWAVRTTMRASDAPLAVLQVLAALRDAATGLPQYFFASLGSASGTVYVPTTFEVVDAAFAAVPVPAVASMAALDGWIGIDPGRAGLAYLAIGGQLRALRWNASGVSVDAGSLHQLGSDLSLPVAVADASALYVSDQGILLSVSDGMATAVGSFSGTPDLLVDAGAWIGAREPDLTAVSAGVHAIEAISKTTHARTVIETTTAGVQLLGATDGALILTGTSQYGQAFVLASGDNSVRAPVGSQAVGLVRAAAAPLDRDAAPVALLSCVAATTGYCGTGPLTQLPVAGGASIALGTLAPSSARVRGDAIVGLAASLTGVTLVPPTAGLGSNEVNVSDAWQFTPGTAGSLSRVSSSLP